LSGPLDGRQVLDLTRILAGPFCAMVLGDLGASVIKVEEPAHGDYSRAWGPPFVGMQSSYFLGVNRNKKSVAVNLKDARGRQIIHELVQRCDVLIENFKPGTMEAWGLGYDTLSVMKPDLVYCSITGFGRTGPYKDLPGYDTIVEALGGLMSITGPSDGPPYKVGVAIIDVVTALYCSTAILAAFHAGIGQKIEVSLLDVGLASLINVASAYLASGSASERYGNNHPNIAPFGTMRTADSFIMLGVGTDQQWERFCRAIGAPELTNNSRFATNELRVMNRQELAATLAPLLEVQTSAAWFPVLMQAGVPAAPVLSVAEALTSEHANSRNLIQTITHPTTGEIRFVASPIRLSETPVAVTQPPPLLGQHTVEVLRDVLGYSAGLIEELEMGGVIRGLVVEPDRSAVVVDD
jgi:glutaryl-CoA transferase